MNTSAETQQEDLCPNCTKAGLPILPLRYAIARSDSTVAAKAPLLSEPFGDGVTGIALPNQLATYALRTLREGYLYIFNEVRGEWRAYEVDRHGVLFEFDIRKNAPPSQSEDDDYREVCSRDGTPPMSQCVIIPDAHKAGRVWMGFSTIPWTRATLNKNKLQKNREKHMRCVDVGAWVASGGTTQPHMAPMQRLAECVAEYAMEIPPPPAPQKRETAEEREARMERNRTSETFELETIEVYAKECPAFDYSLFDFEFRKAQAEDMVAAALAAGERGKVASGSPGPYVPAMIALADPAAIGSELNELAKANTHDWMNEPARKKRHESATMIEAIRRAVQNGGEMSESEWRKAQVGFLGALMPATLGAALGGRPGPAGVAEGMRRAGRLSAKDLDEIHAKSWKKYRKMYNKDAVDNYFNVEFPSALRAFEARNVVPLDKAYIAWIGSPMLRDWMNLNADENDLRSGLAYSHALYVVVLDALGRKQVCDYLGECFRLDPTDENAVFSRAMVFNQEKMAKAWKEAGMQTPATGWDGVVNRVWSGFNALLGAVAEDMSKAAKSLLNLYTYEYAAVLTQRLHAVFDTTTGELIAGAVERRAVIMLGAVAKVNSPRSSVITVRSRMTEMQAMYVATGVAESTTSPRTAMHDSGSRVRDAFEVGGKRVTMQGVLIVDEDVSLRTQGVVELPPEQIQRQIQRSLRTGAMVEGGAHVASALLSLWTLSVASRDFEKTDTGFNAVTLNYIGACSATMGATLEGAGALLRLTRFGSAALPGFASRLMPVLSSRAAGISLLGRLAGAVGGVITGLLLIWEGIQDFSLSPGYAGIMISLGLSIIWVSWAVASMTLGGVPGFFIALLIALVALVVSFMKKDEIERWLDKAIDFGNHAKGSFDTEKVQWDAMQALGGSEED